jgi:protoheme IX farnesyltransferase
MTEAISANASHNWRDYLELCKPRVVALMLLTSLIGMLLAVPGWVPLDVLILGNIGIAACAGAAAVVNHLVDRKVDTKMARTFNRPVAQGRVSPVNAAAFAALLATFGFLLLYFATNPLTAWLTLLASVGYAFIYTLFLKRATPQNIVIGGIAGAAPPLLGWVAVTGEVHGHALLLVLIIFAWTPPHFWALAIHRQKEYANADIPMLPVTHGEKYTKLHVVLYTVILLLVSLLPYATHMLGWIYLTGATVLGIGYIYFVILLWVSKKPNVGMDAFWYSIVYLMALFAIMLADHYFV